MALPSNTTASVATDVRAGEPQVLTEEMNQKKPGLYFGGALDAVDFHFYRDFRHRLRPSFCAIEREVKRPRGEHADEISFVFG